MEVDFQGESWEFFFGCGGWFFFVLFVFSFQFWVCRFFCLFGGGGVVFVLFFFFTCQRSTSSLASSPSECWVSCNSPKATGQCKMEMQFKVLSIRMDKRRLLRKKLMTFYYKQLTLYRCDEECQLNVDSKGKHRYHFTMNVGVLFIRVFVISKQQFDRQPRRAAKEVSWFLMVCMWKWKVRTFSPSSDFLFWGDSIVHVLFVLRRL